MLLVTKCNEIGLEYIFRAREIVVQEINSVWLTLESGDSTLALEPNWLLRQVGKKWEKITHLKH